MPLLLVLFLSCSLNAVGADKLEEQFRNPPEETKPWCYWYWLNSDITADGITKDLEAMARVGIKRAFIGNIAGGGPVKMLSKEWNELTHYAFKEAHRIGVDLMMFNGPGWSQSGGPWIKPEQSMRRVTWNEFPAETGQFSAAVRSKGAQDIAVLAIPRKDYVTITGLPKRANGLSLERASWIWHLSENAAVNAPAATRYFKRVFQTDPAELASAEALLTADNSYTLWINGKELMSNDNWQQQDRISIKEHLKAGTNIIAVAVRNAGGPAGLIAAFELKDKQGGIKTCCTDTSWFSGMTESAGWRVNEKTPAGWAGARVMGGMAMGPWHLSAVGKKTFYFKHSEPFIARALVMEGTGIGELFVLRDGERELVTAIHAGGGNPVTDFLPNGIDTFSFKDVEGKEFELVLQGAGPGEVELTSEPKVAQVIEKQMGRMHPTPSPTWESYIFPETVEPSDPSVVIKRKDIIDLTDKLNPDGVLTCKLPAGKWTIVYFGMITTGKKCAPAPPEATGLECDKMSKSIIEYHFNSMVGKLLKEMTPEEKSAFKGVTIDSYEMGSQNWTDGFAGEFEKRNGYNPIAFLPVMTGRVLDSAGVSDQFLWDLRRTVADMIAENYVGGLRDVAHRHGMTLWLENYGHWGFPSEFLVYGGYTDELGGEFWTTYNLGPIECRAASSAAHIYGKRRVYAEAFTSHLNLGFHPYTFKRRGEEMFCNGINHFVLHVYAHQTRDGVPGKNPGRLRDPG